jgi:hypothetical protein
VGPGGAGGGSGGVDGGAGGGRRLRGALRPLGWGAPPARAGRQRGQRRPGAGPGPGARPRPISGACRTGCGGRRRGASVRRPRRTPRGRRWGPLGAGDQEAGWLVAGWRAGAHAAPGGRLPARSVPSAAGPAKMRSRSAGRAWAGRTGRDAAGVRAEFGGTLAWPAGRRGARGGRRGRAPPAPAACRAAAIRRQGACSPRRAALLGRRPAP